MVVNDQGKHLGDSSIAPSISCPQMTSCSQPYLHLQSSHPVRTLSRQPLPNSAIVVEARQNWRIRHPLIREAHSSSLGNWCQIE